MDGQTVNGIETEKITGEKFTGKTKLENKINFITGKGNVLLLLLLYSNTVYYDTIYAMVAPVWL